MDLENNREVEIFDGAYKLGFHAGQLAWKKELIADYQQMMASLGGEWIAVKRGNISLEEYESVQTERNDDNGHKKA